MKITKLDAILFAVLFVFLVAGFLRILPYLQMG